MAPARTQLMARTPVMCNFPLRHFSHRSIPDVGGPLAIPTSPGDPPPFTSLQSVRLHLPGPEVIRGNPQHPESGSASTAAGFGLELAGASWLVLPVSGAE